MGATAREAAGPGGKSPDAFRTISEVAEELDLPQHVLRFWETRFPQIKPMKRAGGRRLYRPDHVSLLRGIRALLYDDGLTIKGVQKVLREQGPKTVIARGNATAELTIERAGPPADASERLAALRERVEAERTATTAEEAHSNGESVDSERIRQSIARLEDILARLERH